SQADKLRGLAGVCGVVERLRATLWLAPLARRQRSSCLSAGFWATGPTARVLRLPRQTGQTQEVLRSRIEAREPTTPQTPARPYLEQARCMQKLAIQRVRHLMPTAAHTYLKQKYARPASNSTAAGGLYLGNI